MGPRTTSLTSRIQDRLHRAYAIEEAPSVDAFIVETEGEDRETVRVREGDGDLEVEVALPRSALLRPRPTLDDLCQVIEGVSHFLYLAERARRELPTTHLELELQAEVDKYVVLVVDGVYRRAGAAPERAAAIRERLYERVRFLHPAGSERGERYRLANDLAARFARRLDAAFARHGRLDHVDAILRRFHEAGQTEKLELARAA